MPKVSNHCGDRHFPVCCSLDNHGCMLSSPSCPFCSGGPELLLAICSCSSSTVEAGEEEHVEDICMMRSEVGGDVVKRRIRGGTYTFNRPPPGEL
jgi:hypothetical protein